MSSRARLFVVLLPAALASAALADQRIEGVVQQTKVTHCDVTKAGGCAGTLTLKGLRTEGTEPLTLGVPLGTPISCASERVHLHTLQGKRVVVTLPDASSGVARAVEVAESERC